MAKFKFHRKNIYEIVGKVIELSKGSRHRIHPKGVESKPLCKLYKEDGTYVETFTVRSKSSMKSLSRKMHEIGRGEVKYTCRYVPTGTR